MKALNFGSNTIKFDETSRKIIIKLANGGEYDFTIDELHQLDIILSEFENLPRKHDKFSREIIDNTQRLHYSVSIPAEPDFPPIYIRLIKFGIKGYFYKSEISQLRTILKPFLAGFGINETKKGNTFIEKSVHSDTQIPNVGNLTKKIFLVHGHNDGAKETIARFIESMGAEVIILHEKPNMGKTVIEKFSLHSDVSYAIVLLTADDKGGSKNDVYESQKYRARQNVILELGYFIGRLGRERVCCLCEDGIEIPSDFSGVLYIPIDKAGAWKLQLVKELTSAGIPLDFSKVIL